MAHTGKVRDIRSRMLEIYGESCWMGYTIDKKNPFTFHHIFEQRKGGKDLIDNGALLSLHAHHDLNQLDVHKRNIYNELNLLFTALNETKAPPTVEYYKEVNKVLIYASKFITLSEYCNLYPDFELLDDYLEQIKEMKNEEGDQEYIKIDGVYMPVSYQKKDVIYVTKTLEVSNKNKNKNKNISYVTEDVEIPKEYRNKTKKKNRNNKKYKYK